MRSARLPGFGRKESRCGAEPDGRGRRPYFEDLERGQTFDAPALTLTSGHAALHQAIAGDRMLLPLDAELCRRVTGSDEALVHPNLVCDVAIGQSTIPTQRVLGNLFYRGLVLLRPVFCGDTLHTRTEVVALKQNRPRDGRCSGLAVLRIETHNQRGETVLDFYRCPMIPLRDGDAATGHADGFDEISQELDPDRVHGAVPDWEYAALRERVAADATGIEPGTTYAVEGRETVTDGARARAADAERRDDPSRRGRGGPRAAARVRRADDLDRSGPRRLGDAGAGDHRRLARLRALGAGVRGRRAEHGAEHRLDSRRSSARTRPSQSFEPSSTPTEAPATRPSKCSTGRSSASSPEWRKRCPGSWKA